MQHANVDVEGAEVVFTAPKTFMLGLRMRRSPKRLREILGRPVKVRVEVDANA